MWGGKSWGPENTRENGCPAALLAPAGPRVRRLMASKVLRLAQCHPARDARAYFNSSLTASKRRLGSSPKHRHRKHASRRAQKTHAGDARRTKPKLGHLGNTGRRRKGPGVGPVLGPRHEELADGVELR